MKATKDLDFAWKLYLYDRNSNYDSRVRFIDITDLKLCLKLSKLVSLYMSGTEFRRDEPFDIYKFKELHEKLQRK
jgi:hypothetical protein